MSDNEQIIGFFTLMEELYRNNFNWKQTDAKVI